MRPIRQACFLCRQCIVEKGFVRLVVPGEHKDHRCTIWPQLFRLVAYIDLEFR
jgi:hypothetical protein